MDNWIKWKRDWGRGNCLDDHQRQLRDMADDLGKIRQRIKEGEKIEMTVTEIDAYILLVRNGLNMPLASIIIKNIRDRIKQLL